MTKGQPGGQFPLYFEPSALHRNAFARRFAFSAEGYGRERTRPQLAEVNSDQARGYSHLRSCRRTMFQCAGFWS